MRVLITGIDGFVGSHLAEALIAVGGVDVHGTVMRLDAPLRNIAHLRQSLTLHQADVSDAGRMDELFDELRPDRVLHIAGQAFVPASLDDPMGTFQANLLGGLAVLEAARKVRTHAGGYISLLVVSSGEVYGNAPHLPLTEETPIAPNNPYAASKASIDLIAQQYARFFGVDVVIVRPFNHAGPRQNPSFVVSDFARQFARIRLGMQEPVIHVGNIDVQRDFTDVRDVVRAYWSLFNRRSDEFVFNVASNRAVPIRSILTTLEEHTGLHVQIRQERERIRPYDIPVIVASYDRLHRATGWEPAIPLEQTLRDVYDYWLAGLRATERDAVPRTA
ncbi:MAG: GDP-mannose 4,6-dehydratase [Ignavibacteria bacterium]